MKVTIKVRGAGEEAPGLLFGVPAQRSKFRPSLPAILGSISLHVCGIAVLGLVGTVSRPVTRETAIVPLQHEKLIWYFTKDRLPAVAPDERQTRGKPKVQLRRPGQAIVADTHRPLGKQLIWQPAPKLVVERETPLPNLLAFMPHPARPQPRKFVATEPPEAVNDPPRILPRPAPLVTAPAVAVPLPLAVLPGPAQPRPRDFVPPAIKSGAAQPIVILDGAPRLPIDTQQPSMVIVGLEPARINDIPLPEGSRSPRFSAGPESGAGGGHAAAVVVPGLTVNGTGAGSAVVVGSARRPAPAYRGEPSAAEWTQTAPGKDSRRIARSMMSAGLRPGARVIAPFVEARFPARPVYTTSFEVGADASMEWVIWFAEQNADEGHYLTIRPPVPWTRVATGPGPELPPGRLEIAAVIDRAGQLSSVTVLNGGDRAAKEAAANLVTEWVFLPALRNGQPITVDTLIEINFRRH